MKVLLDKIFNGIKMTWIKVILSAIIIGIYVGIILTIPVFKDTSVTDIGATYEWWVLFAVIIAVNCKNAIDSMLKCFCFFLISQPIIYLTEVIFGTLSFEMAQMYYLRIWLPITFLTLPLGFLAYFVKKQNVFGAVVLGLGNTLQIVLGIFYFLKAMESFPRHIVSSIFCFASVAIMSFGIFKKKRYILIAILSSIVLALTVLIAARLTGRVII